RFSETRKTALDVATIQQATWVRGIGAYRRFRRVEIRQSTPGLPGNVKLLGRPHRIFFALRDDSNEVAIDNNGTYPRHIRYRALVYLHEAVAHLRTNIDACIGRANHPAVKHPRHANIVNIYPLARRLGGDIHSSDRTA